MEQIGQIPDFDVVILAAGVGKRLNGGDGNGPPKAWVSLAGKFLWRHVYEEAMKLNPKRVLMVCHSDRFSNVPEHIWTVDRAGSYIGDLFRAMNTVVGSDRLLLIVHADAVLMTAEDMTELLMVAHKSVAGFIWAGVPIDMCFPEVGGRRYVVGGKQFARTNAIVVKPWMLNYDRNLIEAMKKHDALGEVIAGIRVLGLRRCVRALMKCLPVSELCYCMGKALGCKVEVPILPLPRIAFDVDHEGDRVFAHDFIESRRSAEGQ